jgi:MFS family permease
MVEKTMQSTVIQHQPHHLLSNRGQRHPQNHVLQQQQQQQQQQQPIHQMNRLKLRTSSLMDDDSTQQHCPDDQEVDGIMLLTSKAMMMTEESHLTAHFPAIGSSTAVSFTNDDDNDDDDSCTRVDPLHNISSPISVRDNNHDFSDYDHDHDLVDSPSSNNDIWLTLAGVAGNVLEWYDFAVFGFLSDVIGVLFFPPTSLPSNNVHNDTRFDSNVIINDDDEHYSLLLSSSSSPTAAPTDSTNNSSTIAAFAVFAGAFLMRPIGGIVMGHIGDTYGRSRALILSLFLMAVPTFVLGLLPTYQQMGTMAVVLLIAVRLLQGLSVGGQLVSSIVFTLENHHQSQWGFYGSFALAAANFGTLLGSISVTLMKAILTKEQLHTWGWRLPFLSGIIVLLPGIYLQRRTSQNNYHGPNRKIFNRNRTRHQPLPQADDSNEIESDGTTTYAGIKVASNIAGNQKHLTTTHDDASRAGDITNYNEQPVALPVDENWKPKKNPFLLAIAPGNRRSLLAAAMVPTLWAGGFYTSFVWMAIYMSDLLNSPVPHAFIVNSVALFLSVGLFFPVAGILSDMYGRRRVMTIGGLGMGVLGPVMIALIGQGKTYVALIAQCFLGISLSLWGSPMCAWLVESFDPAARLTSVGIGYNLAQSIVGGASPSIATILVDTFGPYSPGFMIFVLAIIAMTGLWCISPAISNNAQDHLVSTNKSVTCRSPFQPVVSMASDKMKAVDIT